jgi:hypothetical protein
MYGRGAGNPKRKEGTEKKEIRDIQENLKTDLEIR